MTLLLLAAFVALALMGTPLFALIGGLALLLLVISGIDVAAVAVEMYRITSSPTLIAVPLFTVAGYVLAESKTPERLVRLSRACLGWLPGGLAIVSLSVCALFTAFTGATGITIIAVGGLLLPALIKEGYPRRFSLGLVTTSGSLGLLFPPSLAVIIYGFVAGVRIDDLFVAGLLPGALLIVLLSILGVRSGQRACLPKERFSPARLYRALAGAAWELPLLPVVIGGIYGGFLTVTEAAAAAAGYVLVVECLVRRDIPIRRLPSLLRESAALVGGILIIVCAALGLTNYLVDAQVPSRLLDVMRSAITSRYLFLFTLNVFLLAVGCIMDIFSALLVVVPLIVPLAVEYDVNLTHLGVIFLVNLGIGYSTPPVGMNLFIASFRFREPVLGLYRASLPFLGVLLIALALVTYVPWLSLAVLRQ
jgi:tripartite ATP-independent transporter DctM subunit